MNIIVYGILLRIFSHFKLIKQSKYNHIYNKDLYTIHKIE